MANYSYTNSRNVMILRNIVYGENNPIPDPPESRVEAILEAILGDTGYNPEAKSRMERILKAIANREVITDMTTISRNEDILLTKMAGDTYQNAPQSQIEEILIDWDLSDWYTPNALLWLFENESGEMVWEDTEGNIGKLIHVEEPET